MNNPKTTFVPSAVKRKMISEKEYFKDSHLKMEDNL